MVIGLLLDQGSTNLWVDSANPANQTIFIDGPGSTKGPHFLSFYGTGTISWDDNGNTNLGTGSLVGTGANERVGVYLNNVPGDSNGAGNVDFTVSGTVT